jgi:NADPH:quinone reductase
MSMKAARIHAFGQDLSIDDVPEPEVGLEEALAHIRFAAVNPLDVWVTQGTVAGGQQSLPFIPGAEAAGEVDGERVLIRGAGLGVARNGLYRERANVPRTAVVSLPEGVDLEQAAGAGVAGSTALALAEVASIGAEDRVLVLGASGGVGSLVVQVAKAAGASVWGQTSSEDKVRFLEELGVDRAVVAGAEDLPAAVREFEATVAIDPLGNGFTRAAVEALQPFGRIVLYGTSAGHIQEMDLRALYRKAVQLHTYSGTIDPPERNRELLRKVVEALVRGDLRVPIDEVLPLDRAAEAHRRIKERGVRGKLLLAP